MSRLISAFSLVAWSCGRGSVTTDQRLLFGGLVLWEEEDESERGKIQRYGGEKGRLCTRSGLLDESGD